MPAYPSACTLRLRVAHNTALHDQPDSKSVQFSVMSPSEIEQAGVLHVFQRALYTMPERKPQVDGVLDPRLVC